MSVRTVYLCGSNF